MWEPDLPSDFFSRDHVLDIERVIDADGWASIGEAKCVGHIFKIDSSRKAAFKGRVNRTNLSPFNGLSLIAANQSQTSLLVAIKLIHGRDCDASPAVSLSGGREKLNAGEQRELQFPREAFGVYRFPDGWSQIREVELTFSVEHGTSTPRSIQISIGPLQAVVREIPRGPRLSQEGLRSVLGEDVPGVTGFFGRGMRRNATNSETGAQKSYTRMYGSGNLGLLIPPPHYYPGDSADQILKGRIMGQQSGYPVDWEANPIGELEWCHFLHRQHFLRELIKGFVNTGDQRYVEALDSIISSWIQANPVPVESNGGAGPSWETLSAAWRLREWLWVVGIAWQSEFFRPKTKIHMLCSIWEHARSLMDHKGHPNNWIIVESAALTLAGLCFPQFKETNEWVKAGLDRLRHEFQRQFFSDGVHFEVSPLYHAICVHALLEVRQVAVAKGIKLPQEFHFPLEKCFDYLAALCRPDFSWPSLNDSGGVTGDYSALMSLAGEAFHSTDFDWIGSRGICGSPPREASRFFPDVGIAAMRTDYSRNSNFLVFRGGPPGAFHVHDDCLSVDVTALGYPRLVDPGITSYAPGTMTDYYRSALAHNAILIDGKGPGRSSLAFQAKIRPAGKDFHWKYQDNLEIATGICAGPRLQDTDPGTESLLIRTVVFVRGEYWIVRDIVAGDGSHELALCWQFFPGEVELDPDTRTAICMASRGSGLELIPLLGSEEWQAEMITGSQHPPRGWISIEGRDVSATTCRYWMRATLPMTIMWLLLPFSDRPRSGVTVNTKHEKEGDILVKIATPNGTEDIVVFPHRFTARHKITAKMIQRGILLRTSSKSQ